MVGYSVKKITSHVSTDQITSLLSIIELQAKLSDVNFSDKLIQDHELTPTGRFISKDPIQDGSNWYAYAGGNPVSRFDPSGLAWINGAYIPDGAVEYDLDKYVGKNIEFDKPILGSKYFKPTIYYKEPPQGVRINHHPQQKWNSRTGEYVPWTQKVRDENNRKGLDGLAKLITLGAVALTVIPTAGASAEAGGAVLGTSLFAAGVEGAAIGRAYGLIFDFLSGYKLPTSIAGAGGVTYALSAEKATTAGSNNIIGKIVGNKGVFLEEAVVAAKGAEELIPLTKSRFGHTFDTHGEGATEFLLNRSKAMGEANGQFLDNQAAAKLINENLGLLKNGPVSIPMPKGFPARMVMPDGTFAPPSTIKLVPGGKGVSTAYPEL